MVERPRDVSERASISTGAASDPLAVVVPRQYQELIDRWSDPAVRAALIARYADRQQSFLPGLLPEQAVAMSAAETLDILRARLGDVLELALDPRHTDPRRPCSELHAALRSPVADEPDPGWLKRTKMVGINVRTIGSFWNVVKYTLTLPAIHDAIHILPIWEPGVVQSLYGPSSWEINREFFCEELAAAHAGVDTVERQLRAMTNILHALGRTVGMDAIPHTDRFSQVACAYPEYFEWLRRQDVEIIDHRSELHEDVQRCIFAFLRREGSASPDVALPPSCEAFFDASFREEQRLLVLFGEPRDDVGRASRRAQLVEQLHRYGYEPVPATMAPPYRGLAVDPRIGAQTIDKQGLTWRDYLFTQPQAMSRVFNPLGRYKLYERKDDNASWEVDFDRPRTAVWAYVCNKYREIQQAYGFDFMRGDMSHVQMRADGVPHEPSEHYDILRAIRAQIHAGGAPYFGYHAESFLAAPEFMAYGDEVDHLEAAEADTALGDLQSTCVGSPEFLQRFRWYLDLAHTRRVTPTFTVMTADKDDPRFDEFYVKGSALRMFVGLFLEDLPSYMALGFETRDVHLQPLPNEHYTKLYVFHEESGPKATTGPYIWGKNGALYGTICRLRLYADRVGAEMAGKPTRWLIPPDATAGTKVIAWTQGDSGAQRVFVCNTDTERAWRNVAIPNPQHDSDATPRDLATAARRALQLELSTETRVAAEDRELPSVGRCYRIATLAPGEARAYRVV